MKSTMGIMVFLLVFLFAPALSAEGAWGASAAKADGALTVEKMLRYAIEDEYLAREEYSQIMEAFGPQRPFSNIIKSEETHISWIIEAYRTRGLPVPADRAAEYTVLPGSIAEALRIGVKAEIDNIAMYDSFLVSPELALASNQGLRDLFTRLRDASKNHLAAFRRGL